MITNKFSKASPCNQNLNCYCQPQFQLIRSTKVQFDLRLSLKPGYFHPHPHPSRDTATSRLPRELKLCMDALFNQTRSTS